MIIDQVMLSERGPYFFGRNIDPDYAYLFNGLQILHRRTPGHVDHPGTPVQVLQAVVIYIGHLFSCLGKVCESIDHSVFKNPELYLHLMNWTLILLISSSVLLFGQRIYKISGSKARTLFGQFLILLFPSVLHSLSAVRPEPLLLATSMTLMALLYDEHIQDATNFKPSVLVGALIGFGLATKVTFLPLFLFVFIFKSKIQKLTCAVSIVSSFVFFTLPIRKLYGFLFSWFGGIATHSGLHGEGNAGVPAFRQLWENFTGLVSDERFFFTAQALILVTVIYIVVSNYFAQKIKTPRQNLIIICGLVLLFQSLITIKHPNGYYMLPSMPVIVLASIKTWELFSERRFGIAFSILLPLGLFFTGPLMAAWHKEMHLYRTESDHFSSLLSQQHCRVIDYYGGLSQLGALNFGNHFTGNEYSNLLREVYPDGHFIENSNIYLFSAPLEKIEIQKMTADGKCLIVDGRKMRAIDPSTLRGARFKTIAEGVNYGAYQITDF